MLANFIAWFTRSIVFGSVIMLGAIGETYTEKAGNLNLGTPGIMAIGAAAAFIGAFKYENSVQNPNVVLCILIPLICAFAASMLAGLLYTFLTVTLYANQNVTGLTLTIFGVGLAKFFGSYVIPTGSVSIAAAATNKVFSANIQTATSGALGNFGQLFLSYGFMMYAALVIAVLSSFILNRTRTGLNLRAIGENPATADAVGINVTKYKYLAITLGAGISGLGGAYYVLDFGNGIWSTATVTDIEAFGWLAVALVIFATWKPLNIIWGAYLFGLCYWAYQFLPAIIGIQISTDISRMAPYVVTIIVLIIGSLRKKRENQAPSSIGVPYFREDR